MKRERDCIPKRKDTSPPQCPGSQPSTVASAGPHSEWLLFFKQKKKKSKDQCFKTQWGSSSADPATPAQPDSLWLLLSRSVGRSEATSTGFPKLFWVGANKLIQSLQANLTFLSLSYTEVAAAQPRESVGTVSPTAPRTSCLRVTLWKISQYFKLCHHHCTCCGVCDQ